MNDYIPIWVRIKLLLRKILPSNFFRAIHFLWIHSFARVVKDQKIVDRYTRSFVETYPLIVQGGPFQGMRYVEQAIGSSYLHKLIGSYESVLHPLIKNIQNERFDTIIDIGSAEGFYLVGLGRMFPKAHLIGFEINTKGHELTRIMYAANDLTNPLTLLGEATSTNMEAHITDHTLLICDCEGDEINILQPERWPRMRNIHTAIIELHDFLKPGIKEALIERFKHTHKITFIPFAFADPSKFPFLSTITNKRELYALSRERGCQEQEWMILERIEQPYE